MTATNIIESLKRTKLVVDTLLTDTTIQHHITQAIKLVSHCLRHDGKLMFVGNGGSAADAQHMSAEYVSRFRYDRPGLASTALTTDTSALTAIGNDYGFDQIFSRQIQAIGREGDVLFAYSTSGTSANIIQALKEAKKHNIISIGMTGSKASSEMMTNLCDLTIRIPSNYTAHIQEGHLIVGHLICLSVEEIMFPNQISK